MANRSSSQVNSRRLENLLNAAEAKYNKQLEHSRAEAQKYNARAKGLESDLKSLRADIDIAVHGQPMSVSLLHKFINGTAYIKARCWWHGKQREVQVGTIPAVLERIESRSDSAKLSGDSSWEELRDNAEIIDLIKDLAREKLRRYIIKRLEAEYQVVPDAEEVLPASYSTAIEKTAQPTEEYAGADWYARWGLTNQSEGLQA